MNLFSGEELRELKMEVRRRMEAKKMTTPVPEDWARDRDQAVWQSGVPVQISAVPHGEWMMEPQQLVVDGEVPTFDLRV